MTELFEPQRAAESFGTTPVRRRQPGSSAHAQGPVADIELSIISNCHPRNRWVGWIYDPKLSNMASPYDMARSRRAVDGFDRQDEQSSASQFACGLVVLGQTGHHPN